MTSFLFSSLFILFLVTGFIFKFWLSNRQLKHISQHREQVPQEFAEKISLRSHQRAADYNLEKGKLSLIEQVVNVVVLVGFTLLGGFNALNHLWDTHISHDLIRQIVLIISVIVISEIISLPFHLYKQFNLEEKFGFNRMTIKLFISDFIKNTLISAILGLPLLALILWLMSSAGNTWWLWAFAVFVGFNLLLLFIYPTLLAPLFNKFSPLENDGLHDQIKELCQRCQFTLNGLFVMDGSRRSAHGNAYFTGFGKNKRIVFFDTLIAKLSNNEIEAVLAHELGHFKHKHIIKRIVMVFFMSFLFFALLGFLKNQTWFYTGLGVEPLLLRPNDALALLLFTTVLPVFTYFITPISSLFSRKDEFEADQYAVNMSNKEDLISALVKLYDDNASSLTPDPLHSAFYDSHPPAVIRIQHIQKASA